MLARAVGVRSVLPMMVFRPFRLHRVDSRSASPQPWRAQRMLSTWCSLEVQIAPLSRSSSVEIPSLVENS